MGGATATVEDFKQLDSGSMWKIVLFVLAFSYLVLFLLLRSVLLSLRAVLMWLPRPLARLLPESSFSGAGERSAPARAEPSVAPEARLYCWYDF